MKAVTNLCNFCQSESLEIMVKFLQVKTSEGIDSKKEGVKDYSFHANLKYHADYRTFYVWIAIIKGDKDNNIPYYYIFRNDELKKFNNLDLDSYQKTDNQKLTLKIDKNARVLNKGRKSEENKYECFNNNFLNNFDKLEEL